MRLNLTSRRVAVGLGTLAIMALVVSPALGGPSLQQLVKQEVSKQLAASTAKKKSKRGPRGPAGPAGPQGAAGATGAAGSALAYAQVQPNGDSLVASRTSGFTGVTNPATGTWCLTVASNIASRVFDGTGDPIRPTLATLEFGNTSTPGNDEVLGRGANSICGPNLIEVHTYSGNAVADDVAFFVQIP